MQPHFIRVTFMKITYYVLKLQQSERGPIINAWTTSVPTLESRRLDINVGDVSLKLQQLNHANVQQHWQEQDIFVLVKVMYVIWL